MQARQGNPARPSGLFRDCLLRAATECLETLRSRNSAPLIAPPEFASGSGESRAVMQPPCRAAGLESRIVVEALGDEEVHHVLHVLPQHDAPTGSACAATMARPKGGSLMGGVAIMVSRLHSKEQRHAM